MITKLQNFCINTTTYQLSNHTLREHQVEQSAQWCICNLYIFDIKSFFFCIFVIDCNWKTMRVCFETRIMFIVCNSSFTCLYWMNSFHSFALDLLFCILLPYYYRISPSPFLHFFVFFLIVYLPVSLILLSLFSVSVSAALQTQY